MTSSTSSKKARDDAVIVRSTIDLGRNLGLDVVAEGVEDAQEVRLPAGGGPPALHRHAPTEVYRVDSGELAIYLEDDDGEVQRIAATPGAVVVPAERHGIEMLNTAPAAG